MQIKELRLRLGLSQAQFAERVGVWKETVSRWENGHNKPSKLAMDKLNKLEVEE